MRNTWVIGLVLFLLAISATGQDNAQTAVAPEPIRACKQTEPPGSDCAPICSKANLRAGKSCVVPPRAIDATDPEYSSDALRNGIEGKVGLSAVITEDGRVTNIKVVSPRGYGLDEKAIEAVRKWQFKPATLNGKPVAFAINIDLMFRLAPLSPRPMYPAAASTPGKGAESVSLSKQSSAPVGSLGLMILNQGDS